MDSRTIALVQQSWAQVLPIAPQAAALFYNNLFEADPALRSLFRGDLGTQGNKLMQMLNGAVGNLNSLDSLVPVLEDLAKRHVGYGVAPDDYDTVGAALLKTLGQGLGDAFTNEVKAAWTTVYQAITGVMVKAAY